MEFQWHCYAQEIYKPGNIDLEESDTGNSLLVAIRSVWLEFCSDYKTPIPTSNPIMMMTISSRVCFYLQDQVAMYQRELPTTNDKSTEESVSNDDGDDVYYRFS